MIERGGMKGFGRLEMKEEEVGEYLKEMFELCGEWKYGKCREGDEGGCGVGEGVENE